jgi:transposase-like protein
MQRIYPCELTPEQYVATEGHRQIRPEAVCPRCGQGGPLHRHGRYRRGITGSAGQVLDIYVARFLCAACGGTVSYLPGFALSYRLVQVGTFEAFLSDRRERRDVQRWQSVLQDYRRRLAAFAVQVWRIVGCGLGRAPPADGALWPWLREACGGLEPAPPPLVAAFRIGLFRRYQCHQPAVA